MARSNVRAEINITPLGVIEQGGATAHPLEPPPERRE